MADFSPSVRQNPAISRSCHQLILAFTTFTPTPYWIVAPLFTSRSVPSYQVFYTGITPYLIPPSLFD